MDHDIRVEVIDRKVLREGRRRKKDEEKIKEKDKKYN